MRFHFAQKLITKVIILFRVQERQEGANTSRIIQPSIPGHPAQLMRPGNGGFVVWVTIIKYRLIAVCKPAVICASFMKIVLALPFQHRPTRTS